MFSKENFHLTEISSNDVALLKEFYDYVQENYDEIITYYYDNIGYFGFFYKTDENKIIFVGYNLYADFLEKQNFPMTIEEVEKYFNHKFYRIEEDENISSNNGEPRYNLP